MDGLKVGESVLETAVAATGEFADYSTDTANKSLVLQADAEQNVIIFIYHKVLTKKYKVEYYAGSEWLFATDEVETPFIYQKIYADTAELDRRGYQLDGEASQYVWMIPGSVKTVKFMCKPGTYDITYHGVDGATWGADQASENPNPTKYTYLEKDITLVAPQKEGKVFLGWDFSSTGDGASVDNHDAVNTVISKDSHGNLSFTARWASLTAEGWDSAYDGQEHRVSNVSLTGVSEEEKAEFEIRYQIAESEEKLAADGWSQESPAVKDYTEKPVTVWVEARRAGYNPVRTSVTLNVQKKTYSVTTPGAEREYNGSALTAEEGAKVEGIVDGETFTFTVTGSRTEVGESSNTYQMTWGNSDGSAKETNYALGSENLGTLKVTAKNITEPENPDPEHPYTMEVSGLKDVPYNGQEQKQAPVVKDGTTTLEENKDYTVSYSDDVTNTGTVTVTISGTGNYTGTITRTYQITQIAAVIKVNAAQKKYGDPDPEFTGAVEGLIGTDSLGDITYSRTNSDENNVGTYEDVLTATVANSNRNYTYTVENAKFTIVNATDNTVTINMAAEDLTKVYDTKPVTVQASAAKEGSTLLYSTDGENYSEEKPSFTDAGTYTVYVKATNPNYEDTASVTATIVINKRPLTITGDGWTEAQPYNGTPYSTNKVTVEKETKDRGLVEGHDYQGPAYTLAGTEAGSYTGTFAEMPKAVITADGTDVTENYALTYVPGNLTIVAQSIDPKDEPDPEKPDPDKPVYAGVTVEKPSDVVYNGLDQRGLPTVKDKDGNELKKDTDYTVSYSNDVKNVGTVTVTIAGKGNYTGEVTTTYQITKAPLTVTTGDGNFVYDGEPHSTQEGVKLEGLQNGETATVVATGEIQNVSESGMSNTYRIDWNGTAIEKNYEVTEEHLGTLTMTEKSITPNPENPDNTMTIDAPSNATYDGTAHQWIPTVKDGDKTLVKDTDYTVTYYGTDADGEDVPRTDFTNADTIKVVITGTGNYAGTVTKTYQIVPKKLTLKSATLSKMYDGEALANGDAELETATGWVGDEENDAKYVFSASQTLVGNTDNAFTVEVKEGSNLNLKNYDIQYAFGTLTVKAKPTDPGEKPVDPDKVVTKTHTAAGKYRPGDTVTFTFSVTNIYAEEKEVTVQEKAGVTIEGDSKKTIVAGEKATFTAKYTVTEADLIAGTFTNEVTVVFGEDTFSNTDEVTEFAKPRAILILNKEAVNTPANGIAYAEGESISYRISVQNKGNITLKNVEVTDSLTGETWTIDEIAPNATPAMITTSYTVTPADVMNGHVLNTVTAAAERPAPNVPVTIMGDDEDKATVTPNPSLFVEKTAEGVDGTVAAGDVITYTIKVTNNGSVSISDITVNDDLTGES